MSGPRATGGSLLASSLERAGVEHVVGLPGTQNVELYEGLRRSSVRAVTTMHELGAAFLANGYARASGKLAALVTIPGPGFAYALPGIAEARLDSAAVLWISGKPAESGDKRFRLQAIPQRAMAEPIVKRVFEVDRAEQIESAIESAAAFALEGEPGPVLVQIANPAMSEAADAGSAGAAPRRRAVADPKDVAAIAARIAAAKRPLIFAGQGSNGAADRVGTLAERLGAPVLTTTSARGLVPEDHPLSLAADTGVSGWGALREILERADLVLALGVKLSHNGTGGFQLRVAPEAWIHVDASADVLAADGNGGLAVCADVGALADALLRALPKDATPGEWPPEEIERLRARARADAAPDSIELKVRGATPPTMAAFFERLRRSTPRDACLVTDSGLHQVMTRKHFTVLSPRGLVCPSDFQSMGFGIPAAIGARLACPERPVVALVGDGAFVMAGMELLTAVRERVPLTVIVFNDGQLNLIRMKQLADFGRGHGTTILNPDFETFAAAIGASYLRYGDGADDALSGAIASDGVTIVEVELADSIDAHVLRARSLARESANKIAGPGLKSWLKRALGRG